MKKLSFSEFAEQWMKDKNCLFISQAVTFKEYQQQIYDAYQSYLSEPDEPILPERWEDIEDIKGYYIKLMDNQKIEIIEDGVNTDSLRRLLKEDRRDVFATETQAKSALATAQLSQLMKAYNGDWEADWDDEKQDKKKYCIVMVKNKLSVEVFFTRRYFLAFKDEPTASLFLKRFEDLIKEYYMMES